MAAVTVELNASQELANQPVIWRLGKLYNVVTRLRRARISEDYAYIGLTIEGSNQEVEQATAYLRQLGMLPGDAATDTGAPPKPEQSFPQPSTIYVRLDTVNAEQAHLPILYRIGKDFAVVVNVERATFDEEEGGSVEVTISGLLPDVQRSIAYLHTTGIHVNPRQRSVTDYSNL